MMLWARDAKPGDFGAFAPRVFERAAEHDPIALEIAEGAARAIGALTRGVVALGAERVALVGGVGEALRPYFEPDIAARLSAAAIRSDRRGDPVRGRRRRAAKGSRAMKVLYGARIFDGERLHDDYALVVEGAVDPGACPLRRPPPRRRADRSRRRRSLAGLHRLADQRRRRRAVQRRADRRGDRRDRRRASTRWRDRLPADGRDRRAARARRKRSRRRARREPMSPARSASMSKGRSSIPSARACIRPNSSARWRKRTPTP